MGLVVPLTGSEYVVASFTTVSGTVRVLLQAHATALFVEDLPDVAGASPIGWLPNGSNLTMTFSGLGAADDVELSDDDGATWDYEPVPDSDGVDEAVTDVRIRPKGVFAPGQNFWVGFRVKIK